MTRRVLISAFTAVLSELAAVPGLGLRGKLVQTDGHAPAIETAGGKRVQLHGDEPTMGVLADKRLAGTDLEAVGHFDSPGKFEIDPIHTRALFVHKDGKKLYVTYWCEVCYIRTYTPGICVCCQKYTDLDLRDPSLSDSSEPE